MARKRAKGGACGRCCGRVPRRHLGAGPTAALGLALQRGGLLGARGGRVVGAAPHGSLELATLAAFTLAIVLVLGVYAFSGSLEAMWRELLGDMLLGKRPVWSPKPSSKRSRFCSTRHRMLASGMLMNTSLVVWAVAGRGKRGSHQPGGFRESFHALRLPQVARIALALACGVALW